MANQGNKISSRGYLVVDDNPNEYAVFQQIQITARTNRNPLFITVVVIVVKTTVIATIIIKMNNP